MTGGTRGVRGRKNQSEIPRCARNDTARAERACQSKIENQQLAITAASCGYMDDGFDHTVTVVGDQVESLLGFGKGEMVCHKLIEVDGAV